MPEQATCCITPTTADSLKCRVALSRQVTGGLTPVEAELLAARRGSLDSALAAGFATVNWLSLTVQQFVKACNQARLQLALRKDIPPRSAAHHCVLSSLNAPRHEQSKPPLLHCKARAGLHSVLSVRCEGSYCESLCIRPCIAAAFRLQAVEAFTELLVSVRKTALRVALVVHAVRHARLISPDMVSGSMPASVVPTAPNGAALPGGGAPLHDSGTALPGDDVPDAHVNSGGHDMPKSMTTRPAAPPSHASAAVAELQEFADRVERHRGQVRVAPRHATLAPRMPRTDSSS